MRILFITDDLMKKDGTVNHYSCGDRMYRGLLTQKDVDSICCFDVAFFDNYGHMIEEFCETIYRHKYDLVLMNKCQQFKPHIINEIREEQGKDCIIVMWYADCREVIPKFVIDLSSGCDWFFSTTGGDRVKEFSDLLPKVNCAYLPIMGDSEYYKYIPIEKVPEKYRCSISFVANSHPWESTSRQKIAQFLANFSSDKVKIYGNKRRDGSFPKSLEYVYAINGSIINISSSAYNHFDKYTSDRLMNIISCFGFPLVEKSKGLDKLFGDKLEFFDSEKSLIDKVEFFINNEQLRTETISRLFRIMVSEFDYKVWAKNLLDVIYKSGINKPWFDMIKRRK